MFTDRKRVARHIRLSICHRRRLRFRQQAAKVAAYDTLGLEIEPILSWLKGKCPDRSGMKSHLGQDELTGYDFLICADVIEHLEGEPDILLEFIERAQPKLIVLSTPDRNLLHAQDAPPTNAAHVREWTFEEFGKFTGWWFGIIDHCVIAPHQFTQMIVATVQTAEGSPTRPG